MWRLNTAGIALTVALSALGCGCESNDTMPMPAPQRPAAAAAARAAAAQAAPAADNTVQAMVAEIDRAAFTVESRDPFMPPRPSDPARLPAGMNETRPCDLEEHPLGNTPVGDLTLMGLVTGTPLPRAMFSQRSGAKAVIVTEGAFAGDNCNQELVAIRDNEVVFELRTTGDTGRATTVIMLNDDRLPAEILGYR